MPDIEDIWDDEEDSRGYVRDEAPSRSSVQEAAPASPADDPAFLRKEMIGLQNLLKEIYDAPTMEAGYAIITDFARQFWPEDPVALGGAAAAPADLTEAADWLDPAAYRKDGTLVRLLIESTGEHGADANPTADVGIGENWETIGSNSAEHTGEDVWQFAGWDWEQDCWTEGHGKVVGWLPYLSAAQAEAERDALREALIRGINEGTDGGAAPDVSTEFLRLAPDEFAAVKKQRDAALTSLSASQAREAQMREALGPVAEAFRTHRAAMDAINAINDGSGTPGADIDALWREADAASEAIDTAMERLCAALSPAQPAQGAPFVRVEDDGSVARGIRIEPDMTAEQINAACDAAMALPVPTDALPRKLALSLYETWTFVLVWAVGQAQDRGGKMHRVHAAIMARLHDAMTSAATAGLLLGDSTARPPGLLAEHGFELEDLLRETPPVETKEPSHG